METNSEMEAEQTAPAAASETPEAPVENAALAAEIPPTAEAPAEPAPAPETEPAADAEATLGDEEGEPTPAEAAPDDPLSQLVAEAQKHRLSPADEERASKLLQEALLDGRAGVGRAIETLPKLAWVIGVNAVTAVWQEMKPTFRTRLLAGLARVDSEAARRVRLSLARGIFKQDVPASLKIAVSVAKDLREKEPGTITPKNAQIFANVFIGRAKPWVTQLPLAELKPAEADLLVQTGLLAAFSAPHPPATQLSMIKWGAEGGRLARLAEAALATIIKGIERWNGKWRAALRREVADLPEALVTALRLDAPAPAERQPAGGKSEQGAEAPTDKEETETEPGSEESRLERAERAERADRDEDDEDDEDEDDDDDEEEKAERQAAPQQPRPRPVYESKTVPPRGGRQGDGRPFSLPDSLRQIEQYVNGLRNELSQAQNRLRQREDDNRRRREQPERAAPIAGAPTPDELARLNQQLEARNTELQARIDEMREDAEMRAASGAVPTEAGATDPAEQLRALLVLKLHEDFADFLALEQEAPDLVIKRHYPVLLRHVFEVLSQEGIKLEEPPPETPAHG